MLYVVNVIKPHLNMCYSTKSGHAVSLDTTVTTYCNGEALLVEIVKLWVTIEGCSLAALWMEEYI